MNTRETDVSRTHNRKWHPARSGAAWVRIVLLFLMLLPAAWIGSARAQTASDAAPPPSASAAADTDDSSQNQDASASSSPEQTGAIQSDLQLLRAIAWGSTLVAVLIALAAYVYMHRNLWRNDSLYGLIIALVLAPAFLWLCTMLTLTSPSRDCLDAILQASQGVPYDAICGRAREGVANFAGMESLWAMVSPQRITDAGLPIPYPPALVKILMYVSTVIAGVVLYFLLKPLCRSFLAHSRR